MPRTASPATENRKAFYLEKKAFEATVARMKTRLPSETTYLLRRIAMRLLTRVILLTRVDTGRARAAWVASLEGPLIGGTAPGGWEGNDGQQMSIGKTEGAVEARLDGLSQYIKISNSVPYILALEFGHRGFTAMPIDPGGYKQNPFQYPTVREPAPPSGWLRFMVGGREVFASQVRVPPHPGFHSVTLAMEGLRGKLNDELRGLGERMKA